MIGAWELSEYMLIVGLILMCINIVLFSYRVFYCKDILIKNEGQCAVISSVVLAVMLVISGLIIWTIMEKTRTLWLGLPLFTGSLLILLLLTWAFRQLHVSEDRSMKVLEAIVGVIEAGDPNLEGHSLHVRNLTMLLYSNLPFSYRIQINPRNLSYAALLLDVGKLGVPRSIINKTGKLEPEEWDLIRRHPDLAVKILEPISSFDTIASWIRYHHERVDGTGYYHLSKEQIPLASRIIAVADTYSAVTMERSYRASMTHADAIAELRRATRSQLDSELVEIFCHIPYHKIEASLEEVKQIMKRYGEGDFRIRLENAN